MVESCASMCKSCANKFLERYREKERKKKRWMDRNTKTHAADKRQREQSERRESGEAEHGRIVESCANRGRIHLLHMNFIGYRDLHMNFIG